MIAPSRAWVSCCLLSILIGKHDVSIRVWVSGSLVRKLRAWLKIMVQSFPRAMLRLRVYKEKRRHYDRYTFLTSFLQPLSLLPPLSLSIPRSFSLSPSSPFPSNLPFLRASSLGPGRPPSLARLLNYRLHFAVLSPSFESRPALRIRKRLRQWFP